MQLKTSLYNIIKRTTIIMVVIVIIIPNVLGGGIYT